MSKQHFAELANVDAEMAVLGSILIDPTAMTHAAARLRPERFYRDAHQTIFEVMWDLNQDGTPCDLILVTDELQRRGRLEEVGGGHYLSLLTQAVATSAHISHYAGVVNYWAVKRRLVHVGGKIAGIGYADAAAHRDKDEVCEDPAALFAEAVQLLDEVGQQSTFAERFLFLTDEEAEAMHPTEGILGSILREGEIVALYGDSDSYKTFLSLSFALSLAADVPWCDMPVQAGAAVFVAAEAPNTIGGRVAAWKRYHGVERRTSFLLEPRPVNLMDHEQVGVFMTELRRHLDALPGAPPLRLVVFDTLATSTDGGDHKDDMAINHVYMALRLVRDAFPGSAILFVDHEGKDPTRGMSGSAKKRANADSAIWVERDKDRTSTIVVHAKKVKDEAPWSDIRLRAESVNWQGDDGRERESLVLVPAGAREAEAIALSANDRKALLAYYGQSGHPEGLRWFEWMAAAEAEPYGLVKSSFNDALLRLMRPPQPYVAKVGQGKDGRYFLTPLGLGTMVRPRYDAGTTGPTTSESQGRYGRYDDSIGVVPTVPTDGEWSDESEGA